MKIKVAPLVAFICVFVAILAGLLLFYTDGIPDAVTTEQMTNVLTDYGVESTAATNGASDELMKAGLQDCIIAIQDDIRIEFYSFDNNEGALGVYREAYKLIVRERMAVPRIQIKTGKLNYKFYSLDANGTYSVTIYVKNTAVYAYCNSENKLFLNSILDEIGYVEADQ